MAASDQCVVGGHVDEQEQGDQEVGADLPEIGSQFRVDERVGADEKMKQQEEGQEDQRAAGQGVPHVLAGVRGEFSRDEEEDALDQSGGEQVGETGRQDAIAVGRQVFRVEEMGDDDRLEYLQHARYKQRGIEYDGGASF